MFCQVLRGFRGFGKSCGCKKLCNALMFCKPLVFFSPAAFVVVRRRPHAWPPEEAQRLGLAESEAAAQAEKRWNALMFCKPPVSLG